MKIKTLIHTIFNEYPLSIEPILTGLTNENYKIKLKEQTVVLRVPNPKNHFMFDYKHEAHVLDLVSPLNLDTPLLYYNKQSGVKCTTYVVNSETFQLKYINRAATLIKKLHSLNKISGKSFNVWETLLVYRSKVSNPVYDLSIYDSYVSSLKIETLTLCHNDLVQGNLLFSDTQDYLIDYEYAKDNDPLFDIMSFITENDIQDEHLRNQFYLSYFGYIPDKHLMHRLNHFEIAHHILWCTWAMMMSETDSNPEYGIIRDLKYKRLLDVLAKENTL